MTAGPEGIQPVYAVLRVMPAWMFSVFLLSVIVLVLTLLVKAMRSDEGVVRLWPPEFSWGGSGSGGTVDEPPVPTVFQAEGVVNPCPFMTEAAACLTSCMFKPPPDPTEMPKAVMGLLMRSLSERHVNRVVVLLPDRNEGGRLREALVEGSMDSPFASHVHDDGSPAGEAMRLNETVSCRNPSEEMMCRGRMRHKCRCQSLVCMPIGSDAGAIAVLQVESTMEGAFPVDAIPVLEGMTAFVAMGLRLSGLL